MLGKAEALTLWRRCGSLVALLLLLRAFEVLVRANFIIRISEDCCCCLF